ncbi:hypothetical protein [Nostocoides sp. HKS02]|uniref:hypothetical protein n=1 Tax=Nostocoides sp. HKS02 TaxID=1813880 RepID=UPI0012B44443|nr:hypothetical protein [Tetrasphaera sp. HKS02]QGN59196.1 hypothetical protein GKE56_16360 [Tetrasphaera sp. HKS02]
MTKQMLILTSTPRAQGWSSNTFIAEMQKHYDVRATYWVSKARIEKLSPDHRDDFICVEDIDPPDIILVDRWLITDGEARVPIDWLRERISQGAQAVMLNVFPDANDPDPGAGVFPFSWEAPANGGHVPARP